MHREKSAKMAIWQKNSHFAILALFSLCIDFKNSFCQNTSYWSLWKTYYSLFLKKYLWPCPCPSMYLSERTNWIISSFPHRISKILFVLGRWDDFGSLECGIGRAHSLVITPLEISTVSILCILLATCFKRILSARNATPAYCLSDSLSMRFAIVEEQQ